MLNCPKCGGWKINGPYYKTTGYEGERLEYVCRRCGYTSSTPTLDKLKEQEALKGAKK